MRARRPGTWSGKTADGSWREGCRPASRIETGRSRENEQPGVGVPVNARLVGRAGAKVLISRVIEPLKLDAAAKDCLSGHYQRLGGPCFGHAGGER